MGRHMFVYLLIKTLNLHLLHHFYSKLKFLLLNCVHSVATVVLQTGTWFYNTNNLHFEAVIKQTLLL